MAEGIEPRTRVTGYNRYFIFDIDLLRTILTTVDFFSLSLRDGSIQPVDTESSRDRTQGKARSG